MSTTAISRTLFTGATRWIEELQIRGTHEAMRRLRTAPRYRDLTPTQYHNSFEWLRRIGLVDASGLSPHYRSTEAIESVLGRYLEDHNPAWLSQIDDLIRDPMDLPIDILDLVEETTISDARVLEICRVTARKFDDRRLKEIGRRGEGLLVELLGHRTGQPLIWVSETDDTAGFDIYVGNSRRGVEIEVKTTVMKSRVRFYLSRNEYRRMQSSERWALQIVVMDNAGIADLFFVDQAWMENSAPRDVDKQSAWQSASFVVSENDLQLGLHPRILSVIDERMAFMP